MLFLFAEMSFGKVSKIEEEFKDTNGELIANISLMKQEILSNNLSEGNLEKVQVWSRALTMQSEMLGSGEEIITQTLVEELGTRIGTTLWN